MWVSRKEFDKLKAELDELKRKHEAHVVDVAANRNFTVYSDRREYVYSAFNMHERYASQQISLKDVMYRILDRLGIQLVYVEGKPAVVEMKKVKKAA